MYLRASPARASPFILQRCTVAMSDRASPRTASMAQDLSQTRRCKNPREPACYVSGSCVPCIFGVPRCCNLGQEPGTRNQGDEIERCCLPACLLEQQRGHADRTKVHMHKRTGQKRREKKKNYWRRSGTALGWWVAFRAGCSVRLIHDSTEVRMCTSVPFFFFVSSSSRTPD